MNAIGILIDELERQREKIKKLENLVKSQADRIDNIENYIAEKVERK